MARVTERVASGVAQADVGQTTIVKVPRSARSSIWYLNVVTVAGTTPLTDFKFRYVIPKITAAPVVATGTGGAAAVNEIQTLSLTAGIATETFKLTFNAHESSAAVTLPTGGFANVTAAQIKTCLLTISDWTTKTADIAVVKTLNDYAITFTGTLAALDIGAITVTSKTGAADGSVAETVKGVAAAGEVQTISLTGGPTAGSWKLTWPGVSANTNATTDYISATATAAQVQALLNRALPTSGAYDGADIVVARTGSGTTGAPYVYSFTHSGPSVVNQNIDAMTADGSKLYTHAVSTTTDFAGWDGITQIAGTTAGEVQVIVGPYESDTADDTGAIYQIQAELPEYIAAVTTFDRTTGNETYTWSLYVSWI